MEGFEPLICAVLRGESIDWPVPVDTDAVTRFLESARYHGVLPLLNEYLSNMAGEEAWPARIMDECREETIHQAMIELARRQEFPRVLDALTKAGIKPLVLKGGALAYSHYPTPTLRPRGDTDILILPHQTKRAEETLALLGYERRQGTTGELVSYQATWKRTDPLGATHSLDLHWRISNSHILAKVLNYQELEPRSKALPGLGPNAYALAPVDALLFACIHRAGHTNSPYYVGDTAYVGGGRLIWLYDIHLLVTAMARSELDEFAALAASKRIKAICCDALSRSSQYFATRVPPEVLAALTPSGRMEPSARYFSGGHMRQMFGDLLALESWGDRARWTRETVFPSAAYMRSKYPDREDAWLPGLYLRRAFGGLRKLASRPARHEH